MRGVIFLPNKNVKRADYTGAFHPEAKWFRYEHSIPKDAVYEIDIDQPSSVMRRIVCEAIEKERKKQYGPLQTVAFFCHGWKTGIQLGFEIENIPELVSAMEEGCASNVVVPLYACSTARDDDRRIADDMDPDNTVGGDGGFADELRDALCSACLLHCRVVGHVTAGHSTYNPWVRFFDGSGIPYGGTGGNWVVRPKGPLWKYWINWLREKDEKQKDRDNQFKFPFMTVEEIHAAVYGLAVAKQK